MALPNYVNVLKHKHQTIGELFQDIDILLNSKQNISDKKHSVDESCNKALRFFDLIDLLNSAQNKHHDVAINIDKAFQVITVTCNNILGVPQYIRLKSSTNDYYTICDHSLPEMQQLNCLFLDVNNAINVFKECVSNLSEYFETMADIDGCCWIIDPSVPTSKDNFRRIVIGDNVSIQVTVDCKGSKDIPHINVLGSSEAVETLSHKIHQYADKWNPDINLTLNLLDMLGLAEFPTKPVLEESTVTKPMEVECGICLSSRDAVQCLPSIICENKYCGQNFHTACLYQWLSTVSGNIQTFDIIHGECPSCLTAISCSVVEFAE